MKDIFFIKDSLTNKITYYHLLGFVVTLPFDRIYSELILISLLAHTLIHFKKNTFWKTRRFLFPASIYILAVLGTFYSPAKEQALDELARQLSILLLPFIFSVTSIDLSKYKLLLLKAFSITCVITVLYLYYDALHIIAYNKLSFYSLFSAAFFNHNFSAPIDLHATYFSMYIALSLATLMYCIILSHKKSSRLLYAAGFLILLAGLFQLSSRAVFIAVVIIVNLIIPFLQLKGRARNWYIIVSVLLSVLSIYALSKNDSFKKRYIVELKEDLAQVSINNDILEPRAVRWASVWELIKKAPVIGHGTGTEIGLLKEEYFRVSLYNSYVNELNSHNQYLSFWLKTGICGLLIFLMVLFIGFYNAILLRDVLFCSFLAIITIVCFSENILDVNKGIFFFGFFLSLFLIPNHNGSVFLPGSKRREYQIEKK